MTILADPRPQSASDASASRLRRICSSSLLEVPASALALVTLAGLPVLAAAWALMSPPYILSKRMTWDTLFNLSGAWHLYLGQVAHVDFHEPVGRLYFGLTAIGFHLLGPGPFALLVNMAIVVSVLFVASFLAVLPRLPLVPAAIFVVFVCLLALMPANVGDQPDQYTFAMSYNRHCWSAFSILALILFVPPNNRRGNDALDIAVGALLLVAMFYLKITYFAAGLAAVAFAVLFHPHVRRRWAGWLAVGAFVVGNALAPYNHPYLLDILAASKAQAIRSSVSMHLNYFFAAAGEYAPYAAAFVVACWMWRTGHATVRFPLAIAFLFAISLLLLSQNSQTAGLPSTIVIVLMFYDQLRPRPAGEPRLGFAPLLLALVVFPMFSIGASAMSIAGYHAMASRTEALYVVDRTNLRGLAVPAGERGALTAFSHGQNRPPSQHEYVEKLLEAADLLAGLRDGKGGQPGGVALFETVNPLPFMLGLPPRRANLWSDRSMPLRPADEYLDDVKHVLIPKFSGSFDWTAALVSHYASYLAEHFHYAADTPSWILLTRSPPGVPPQPDLASALGAFAPYLKSHAANR